MHAGIHCSRKSTRHEDLAHKELVCVRWGHQRVTGQQWSVLMLATVI